MHGNPALPPDFAAFPHVRRDAPKGGLLTLAELGPFDSLNPYILRGEAPALLRSLVFGRLMERTPDEPFTLYGSIARTVEIPEDRAWVEFALDPRARFHDGTPVTVDDVVFSMEALRSGAALPNTRFHYERVARIERPGPGRVRFVFDPERTNAELPLIMGLMPVLSKTYFTGAQSFDKTTLEPPLGAGPYRVVVAEPGRRLELERVGDWWAADLPAYRGRYNFDRIRIDYYRDENAAFEAFKSGAFDLRIDADPTRWATGYEFPALRRGEVLRGELAHGRSAGMFGFAMNTRRAVFADRRVRQAVGRLLDFEWLNASFYHGAYARTRSFFDNSDLAALGPASEAERALLAPFEGAVSAALLDGGWTPPPSGSWNARRQNLVAAKALLEDAGYAFADGAMRQVDTGRPLAFEILITNPDHERLAVVYSDALGRVGIEARVRRVDASQFQARARRFAFDMLPWHWRGTLSPGNEQVARWSSAAADQPGSLNLAGVRSEAVDALIGRIVDAPDRAALVAAARALDRILLSGAYVVPLFHFRSDRVAWSSRLGRPETTPLTGFKYDRWWDRSLEAAP
jgi:ABC-type oligopeptide transport system substrate-binding subunit